MEKEFDALYAILSEKGVTTHRGRSDYVVRQIKRRIKNLRLSSTAEYEALVRSSDEEMQNLVHISTIHTTYFFREASHFDVIRERALNAKGSLRVFVIACATGQEVYSAAMTLESVRQSIPDFNYAITATDIDLISLERARKGTYSMEEFEHLPAEYHSFVEIDPLKNEFTIKSEIRERCRFFAWNALDLKAHLSWYEMKSKSDVLFCRNVLIYFDPMEVERMCGVIDGLLSANGLVCFGHAESNSLIAKHFTPMRPSVFLKKSAASKAQAKTNRIIIIDDSLVWANRLKEAIEVYPGYEVCGVFPSGQEALSWLEKNEAPHLIVVDLIMPGLNGLEFLRRLPPRASISVLLIPQGLTKLDTEGEAIALGAAGVLEKSESDSPLAIAGQVLHFLKYPQLSSPQARPRPSQEKQSLLVIGSSTGGPEALRGLIRSFGKDCPPTVIIQHMPKGFTSGLANRLNQISAGAKVVEGSEGMQLEKGKVIVAPGGYQFIAKELGQVLYFSLQEKRPEDRFAPSVDVFLSSLEPFFPKSIPFISVGILTGMGSDGAKATLTLKQKGAHTWGQDEKSSVVYGMAKRAVELGAVERVYSLEEIPEMLEDVFQKGAAGSGYGFSQAG